MRLRWFWLVVVVLAGCGEGPPPLDELPLRDALRADPEVVAALPDDARAKLAARLEAARAGDAVSDAVGTGTEEPAALVAALDLARARRSGDPLIAGVIAGGVATPVAGGAGEATASALPPLETDAGTPTADLERAALNGAAGDPLRALLRTSGAARLRRVTGWPTGAVAIGDSVYVNAAWLVALAPATGNAADGGAAPGPAAVAAAATTVAPAPVPAPRAQAPAATDGGPPAAADVDGGAPAEEQSALTWAEPDGGTTVTVSQPTDTSFWDACGSCSDACASTDDSSCDDSSSDSCDSSTDSGSSDSCNNTTDDGSTDSCNNTTDDGSTDSCNNTDSGDSSCEVGRGRGRGRGHRHGGGKGTMAWLLTPLGYLMARDRSSKVRPRS
jgi:hypothetical protein